MSLRVSVLASSQLTSLDMRPEDDVKAVKDIMEGRIKDSTKFSATPLPAPLLALRGVPLKNETKLSELHLSPGDHLVFLYPLVDPEPSRNRPVGQWKKSSRMDVDSPSTSLGSAASLASTLDGVLAAVTGRAPAMPNMSTGENAAALKTLKDMGFPEARCKKALLLNNMDVEAALGWICDHMNDEDIDDPLTDEQLRQCDKMMKDRAQKQQQDTVETKKQREKDDLESCVAQNTCTYAVTGPRMAFVPEYYMCYTCGLDGSRGCCGACASICHAGHVMHRKVLPPSGSFYCDCPESGSCKCCPPESMPNK